MHLLTKINEWGKIVGMIGKDFDRWNWLKKKLDRESPQHVYFHEREVWFCSIGVNVGVERDSRNSKFSRPVAVVKKFNESMFWGVPLSSQTEHNGKYNLIVQLNGQPADANVSQLRLFDRKRLQRRFGMLPHDDFERVVVALRKCLPIKSETPH